MESIRILNPAKCSLFPFTSSHDLQEIIWLKHIFIIIWNSTKTVTMTYDFWDFCYVLITYIYLRGYVLLILIIEFYKET